MVQTSFNLSIKTRKFKKEKYPNLQKGSKELKLLKINIDLVVNFNK